MLAPSATTVATTHAAASAAGASATAAPCVTSNNSAAVGFTGTFTAFDCLVNPQVLLMIENSEDMRVQVRTRYNCMHGLCIVYASFMP